VSFTDVSDSAWYADYVAYLAARGIVGGNNGTFSPDASITRAEVVTILARMSDDDLSGYTVLVFTDVTTSDWYFAAVQWAYVNGSQPARTANLNQTRQSPANRWRPCSTATPYAGIYQMPKACPRGNLQTRQHFNWVSCNTVGIENGIITGNGDGSFAPASNATRAEAAAMLERFIESAMAE
jgi:hypothetical protein